MSRAYCDYILDQLSGWSGVVAKRMFGGYGLYRHGVIFALMIEETLYFKVEDTTRARYEAAHSEPFTYEAKGKPRQILSYWRVPSEIIEDSDALHQWAEDACDASLRNQVKKPKR